MWIWCKNEISLSWNRLNFYQPSFWVAFLTEIKICDMYNLVKKGFTYYFLVSALEILKDRLLIPITLYCICEQQRFRRSCAFMQYLRCLLTYWNIQPKNQSSRPAKGLSMHIETLTVRTVRMALFLRRGLYYIFLFPLCKIVWGNYVPRYNIWASSWVCANNQGSDQPAHPHNLINAFVVCYLESKIT